VEHALEKTNSLYQESISVLVHYGVTSEEAVTMNLTADDIEDDMIFKSQQLSNNKLCSPVPKQTAEIAAKLRLFLRALQD